MMVCLDAVSPWKIEEGIRGWYYVIETPHGRLTATDGNTRLGCMRNDGHHDYVSIDLYAKDSTFELTLYAHSNLLQCNIIDGSGLTRKQHVERAARRLLIPLHHSMKNQGLPDNLREGLEALFKEAKKVVLK